MSGYQDVRGDLIKRNKEVMMAMQSLSQPLLPQKPVSRLRLSERSSSGGIGVEPTVPLGVGGQSEECLVRQLSGVSGGSGVGLSSGDDDTPARASVAIQKVSGGGRRQQDMTDDDFSLASDDEEAS